MSAVAAMIELGSARRKNRRLGLVLGLVALLYIAAVIAFIIIY
jgi:ABC-type multidrug transport system permease subunit